VLGATVGVVLAGEFLWQEVLEPMGDEQRRMLAVLCDLGGGDDRLLSAAMATAVEFDASVPLVAVDAGGWHAPHALWQSVRTLRLADGDQAVVRRRAATELIERGGLDQAFGLLAGARLWEDVPSLLVHACRTGMRPNAYELRDWLARCPESVMSTPAGQLAVGVLAALTTPELAAEPLRAAAAGLRRDGDVTGELTALSHLGHVAWWQRNLEVLAELAPRIAELAAAGDATATALDAIGRAIVCNIVGDHEGVLAALDNVQPGVLDTRWEAVMGWFRGIALHALGDEEAFLATVEEARVHADPAFRVTIDATLASSRWVSGHLDDLPAEAAALVASAEVVGVSQDVTTIAATCARACAYIGERDASRTYLRKARAVATHVTPTAHIHIALAEAALLVLDGDEDGATAALRRATGVLRPDASGRLLDVALAYVLLPESRPAWDEHPVAGAAAPALQYARAVAAGRDRSVIDPIDTISVDQPDVVRAALPLPFAVELAVRLHDAGRTEDAGRVLEALGPAGRDHARRVRLPAAAGLLATVPAAPSTPVEVSALGPLRVAGREIERLRVRELLGYLLLHRRTTRADVAVAMWPDLDDRAAANNLRVTLSHLLRLLEPRRAEGEAAYCVRQDGTELRLVVANALAVDLDAFDLHLREAATSEAEGVPSFALEHALAAVDLYRGDLLADLPDIAWADIERERCRTRFVGAAVRAGELLAASNQPDRAEQLAQRALAVDEYSEAAYGVLGAAALARGDRSAALRIVARCEAMLDDLGVEPASATQRLARIARSAEAAA
jgi:DNA-binding SARP family transcriptional activator